MLTSVRLDDDLHHRLKKLASTRQRSASFIMKEALAEYLRKEEAQQSFLQEALDSWEEYQTTGMHVTKAETQDWLKTWGTKNRREAPKCHD